MTRLLVTIFLCISPLLAMSHEHLRFVDISLTGTLDAFCDQLAAKGFTKAAMSGGEDYVNHETRKMTGTVCNISDCAVYVRRYNALDNVSSIIIENTAYDPLHENIEKIITYHDRLYGTHQYGDSKLNKWYLWQTSSGAIKLEQWEFSFILIYTDFTELVAVKTVPDTPDQYADYYESQTVSEICGIPFGTSYDDAMMVLRNKYGEPLSKSDKTKVYYQAESYANMMFSEIVFLFQGDGANTYFNGCIFLNEARSLAEAKQRQKYLYDALSRKYHLYEDTDRQGYSIYYGGLSPLYPRQFAFTIKIIDQRDFSESWPYTIRLMYGRYNYAKEEF